MKVLRNVKVCPVCESVLIYDDNDIKKIDNGTSVIVCPVCGSYNNVVVDNKSTTTVLEDLGILGH